jgi:hypothetical protein
MSQIDEWVQPLEEVGLTSEAFDTIVNEERLGQYNAPGRRLVFRATAIRFAPKARLIIGGDGRVDILGANERLLLIYTAADDAWSIVGVADTSNRRPFDKDRFEEILKAYL